MKHNKKRNTAFLYESLIKELTVAIVRKNNDRKNEKNRQYKVTFDQRHENVKFAWIISAKKNKTVETLREKQTK